MFIENQFEEFSSYSLAKDGQIVGQRELRIVIYKHAFLIQKIAHLHLELSAELLAKSLLKRHVSLEPILNDLN